MLTYVNYQNRRKMKEKNGIVPNFYETGHPKTKKNQAAMKSRVLSTLSRLFTEPSGDGKQLIHSPGKVLVVSPGVSDRVADGIHPGTLRTARLVVDSNDYWNDYWNIVQYFLMGI
jgi:hypothetical protein